MLDQVYKQVQEKIKKLVAKENAGDKKSFTTDCWSGSTESLMSLTAHFIDNNWERQQVVLNTRAMSGSHTAQYIGDTFMEMLEFWGIEKERVLLVLRDSGANMIKGMRLIDLPDWSCCAHTLQLVVNDGLGSQRMVGDIIARMKRIATHFGHSLLAKQRLQEIQEGLGVEPHTILQAVQTRWNSVLYMIERMYEQKRALTLYAAEFPHFT